MTEQEAKVNLEVIREHIENPASEIRTGIAITSLTAGIEALEKQIPKKPILKSGESVMAIDYADGHGEIKKSKWQDWVCPVCGWFVGKRFNADQRKPHDCRKSCYCNECGQRIDWSEEE